MPREPELVVPAREEQSEVRTAANSPPPFRGGGTMYVAEAGESGVAPRPELGAPAGTEYVPWEPDASAQPQRSRPAARPGPVGGHIGQYEIIRELGRGGMGVVYLARDARLGRRVALKILQTENEELTRRFLIEARATAQCSHENIVVIHEVGEHSGSPYMVLEYLQGQTLAALLDAGGTLPPARTVEIMVAVLRALSCAHALGIVHRDLKPENIFLTETGLVKVLDFGIAKVLRDDRTPEAGGLSPWGPAGTDAKKTGLVGTLAYMAPEQWHATMDVDHRADIWAVGVMLFEMLAGRRPVEGTPLELQRHVADLRLPMPSLRDAAASAPIELSRTVDRCLRKLPAERFGDVGELRQAIEPFLPGRFKPWLLLDKGPYTGLRAFQEEDAACFFGRSKEIAAIVTRIHDWPLLAVVGPSGTGKSSLVRAGVVPALRTFGSEWQVLVTRPGRAPLLSLAAALAPILNESATVEQEATNQQNLGIRLAFEPGYLGSALRAASRNFGRKHILFVDQFEELYTLCQDPAQRKAFAQCLSGAADDATSPIRVIVSIRSDFLGRVAEDAQFMAELSRGLFFLGQPDSSGLREVLVQPAELVGFRFENEAMVSDMLRYLEKTPGALPLLQFTAAQLWEARDVPRKLLTEASYRALGGIGGALALHADRVVEKLTPESKVLCRAVFLQLVTAERTRAIREVDELRQITNHSPELEHLLQELVESRLLVVQTGGGSGGATVEIVHESLIENWLTLRRWLEESHEDSMFLEQLRSAARQWETKRRDAGLLWGGEMAEELDRFRRRFRGELPEVTRDFIQAVGHLRLRRAHLKRRLTIAGGILVAGLLAAASVALVIVSQARQHAEENARAAHQAREDAQRRLAEVQEKERQRLEAESQTAAARARAKAADETVALTNEELAQRNIELREALAGAESQRELATKAQRAAEENERIARDAESKAESAKNELEVLLAREKDRSSRLSKQLGSPMVDVLR